MELYDLREQLIAGVSYKDINLNVTFYARVSTDKDEQVNSLENQINYYEKLIKDNPNWTYVDGYVDEGISGTSVKKRESFLRMIDDAEANKFDLILTKEISRFSRDTIDSLQYTKALLDNGVGVLFESDNINTLLPDMEFKLTMMSSMAQEEVRKISDRIKFGHKRAIDSGRVLGNSKIWGYNKEDGKLVKDEKQAEIVKRIFELYVADGGSIRGVVKELHNEGYANGNGNDFSFSTIKSILANPKYKGYYCGRKTQKLDYRSNKRKVFSEDEWIVYEDSDNVPAIVSEELWERANTKLNSRSKVDENGKKTVYNTKYKYSGKIVCGEHKSSYHRTVFKYGSGNKEAWRCKEYALKGKAGCISPTLYTSEIDEIMKIAYSSVVDDDCSVIDDLIEIYKDVASSMNSKNSNIPEYNKSIKKIKARKEKLLDLCMDGSMSHEEYKKNNDGYNKQIEEIEKKIKDEENDATKNENFIDRLEDMKKIMSDDSDFAEGFPASFVDAMLDRIEVYSTDDKKIINLKVYFKIFYDEQIYSINRKKNTSVCYAQYI